MKIIELFAGVGTQRKAFEMVFPDTETVGISEIDKRAIKAYTLLHGETQNFGDISKIDVLPQADIWTYSFPCTDISVAGKQKGFEGEQSSLLFQVKRLLETSPKPRFLIMENVANLVSPKFLPDFEKWIAFLNKQGYCSSWQKIKACDYGGVTIRNRVFMVSVLGDKKYQFPAKTGTNRTIGDILCPPQEENLIDRQTPYKIEPKNYVKSLPLSAYGSGGQGNHVYSVFGQGVTLTASGGGKGGSGGGLYAREEGIYRLSGKEMVKAMGWDEEVASIFEKNFSRRETGFLMGNAIDLSVMINIVKGIKNFIEKEKEG